MASLNNCDVTDDSDQSVSTVTGGHNRQSIASQRHDYSAPATVEDYLAVLPDDPYNNTRVRELLIEPGVNVSAKL